MEVNERYVKTPFPTGTAIDIGSLRPDSGIAEIRVIGYAPMEGRGISRFQIEPSRLCQRVDLVFFGRVGRIAAGKSHQYRHARRSGPI